MYPRDATTATWFDHYARLFDTVELNNTFYRLPSAGAVDLWARQAPAGFVYAVKVGQFVTHRKKLGDPQRSVSRHLDRAVRLDAHLGPNLLQLPPHWNRDPARLDDFLSAAPRRVPGHNVRWVVELRDPSWLHDDVYEVLRRHGTALCLHDLLARHPDVVTAPFTYLRFHGPHAREQRYAGRYGGRRLWRAADRIGAWLDDGIDVYAYFNNDAHGDAVRDAQWLRDRIGAPPRRHSSPSRSTAERGAAAPPGAGA